MFLFLEPVFVRRGDGFQVKQKRVGDQYASHVFVICHQESSCSRAA